MSLDTSGYRGWMPVKFYKGKDAFGNIKTREGYKNTQNDQEFIPEGGWNVDPPYPTGELGTVRHSGDDYREGYERIRWNRDDAG
jgi:hypothetical protein